MDTVIFDFSSADQAEVWRIVNDGVMGGRSESQFLARGDSTVTFSGTVSLENSGGFASVRSLPWDFGLPDSCRGIRIRVRGDGQTYKFRLRLDDRFDGIAYQTNFVTVAGEWSEFELPFDTFHASFRGRTVPGAGPIVPSAIRQFGFLIADAQEGPFRLDVDWIKVLSDSPSK
jgi:NADH dehydrogenase [ubiquinone] 1 alpha subcomplex assembly factor 1